MSTLYRVVTEEWIAKLGGWFSEIAVSGLQEARAHGIAAHLSLTNPCPHYVKLESGSASDDGYIVAVYLTGRCIWNVRVGAFLGQI